MNQMCQKPGGGNCSGRARSRHDAGGGFFLRRAASMRSMSALRLSRASRSRFNFAYDLAVEGVEFV